MINKAVAQKIVTWCKQHDWGFEAYFLNGQIHGLVDHVYNSATQESTRTFCSFDSIQDIRNWAGY